MKNKTEQAIVYLEVFIWNLKNCFDIEEKAVAYCEFLLNVFLARSKHGEKCEQQERFMEEMDEIWKAMDEKQRMTASIVSKRCSEFV